MGDSTIPHEALTRFEAVEARLKAVEEHLGFHEPAAEEAAPAEHEGY